jgi:predicted transcriptional regulator
MPEREHIATIVSAYAKRNALAADQLPALIATVHGALARLEGGGLPEPPRGQPEPAVSVRRSVQPDAITCLDCGRRAKMLTRHLMTAHQLTPAAYRERWGLKGDYPLVAPDYAARRSELAKSFGLGRQSKGGSSVPRRPSHRL